MLYQHNNDGQKGITMEQQPWEQTPRIKGIQVSHGKGKSVVTGVVSVSFTGFDSAFVRTEAHVNDDAPAVTYRDREWLVNLHVIRDSDGTWRESDSATSYDIHDRRSLGGGDAPTTFRTAIVAAMLVTVAEVWTPELGHRAASASAAQDLNRYHSDYVKASAALAEVEAKIQSANARRAAALDALAKIESAS